MASFVVAERKTVPDGRESIVHLLLKAVWPLCNATNGQPLKAVVPIHQDLRQVPFYPSALSEFFPEAPEPVLEVTEVMLGGKTS